MTDHPSKAQQDRKDMAAPILWFEDLRRQDVGKVGGKNSSLGEMVGTLGAMGVQVPPGFATTSAVYWKFLKANALDVRMGDLLDRMANGKATLAETGRAVRSLVLSGDWPADTVEAIMQAYRELSKRAGKSNASVAVRSSATAEDLPDASFAGQQETFLNVVGEAALLELLPPLLRFALHRSRHQLSAGEGLQPYVRGAVDRGSADGAIGPSRIGRDVLNRH